jgi:hypothetical protein
MHPNLIGTAAAVLAFAAYAVSQRRGSRLPRRKRYLLTLLWMPAALPGASFAAYYTHWIQPPAWYYEFRSWPGSEAALIPIGIAGGLAAACAHGVTRHLPYVIAGAFVLVPLLKPYANSIPDETFRDHWSGHFCMQSTASTCGPASTATILHHLGHTESESAIARDAHSSGTGTEAWYLARAIRKRGFRAQFHVNTSAGFDPGVQLPAIAGVQLYRYGHFIALLRREGDNIHIADPLRGPFVLSLAELEKQYTFSGFYLTISRSHP